jgi:cytochrome c oxidase assembly protein subunit 11
MTSLAATATASCRQTSTSSRLCARGMHKSPVNNISSKRHNSSSATKASSDRPRLTKEQRSAFEYYRRKQDAESTFISKWWRQRRQRLEATTTVQERNYRIAWYAAAIVVGATGAAYAAVPLYKVFCQTTGFGGTTQRVRILKSDEDESQSTLQKIWETVKNSTPATGVGGARVHTWTDEEAAARLATLKPVKGAELITVSLDTTVGDILPWTFEPIQRDIKVVPGETALTFFRVTNHSPTDAITGVATYNVHPPKLGLYFQKIQCFCFEEQRLLPGETVDMPVFFFIDPEMLQDPQVSYIRSVTLSYTFFPTDSEYYDDEDEDEEEVEVDTKQQESDDEIEAKAA